MDKIKIGLPRCIYYYDEGKFLKYFLEELNFEVILSKETDEEIIELANKHFGNDINISSKIFLGQILYLLDKCDYILNINNNFTNNDFNDKVININIDNYNYKILHKELLFLFNKYNIDRKQIKNAYLFSKIKVSKDKKQLIIKNTNKLYLEKNKVLLVSHDYILFDNYITEKTINYLSNYNIEVIYSNLFDKEKIKEITKNYYNINLNKEILGSCLFSKNNVNGIIFLSSNNNEKENYTNEYVMNKISLPSLELLINEKEFESLERKLESFIYKLN